MERLFSLYLLYLLLCMHFGTGGFTLAEDDAPTNNRIVISPTTTGTNSINNTTHLASFLTSPTLLIQGMIFDGGNSRRRFEISFHLLLDHLTNNNNSSNSNNGATTSSSIIHVTVRNCTFVNAANFVLVFEAPRTQQEGEKSAHQPQRFNVTFAVTENSFVESVLLVEATQPGAVIGVHGFADSSSSLFQLLIENNTFSSAGTVRDVVGDGFMPHQLLFRGINSSSSSSGTSSTSSLLRGRLILRGSLQWIVVRYNRFYNTRQRSLVMAFHGLDLVVEGPPPPQQKDDGAQIHIHNNVMITSVKSEEYIVAMWMSTIRITEGGVFLFEKNFLNSTFPMEAQRQVAFYRTNVSVHGLGSKMVFRCNTFQTQVQRNQAVNRDSATFHLIGTLVQLDEFGAWQLSENTFITATFDFRTTTQVQIDESSQFVATNGALVAFNENRFVITFTHPAYYGIMFLSSSPLMFSHGSHLSFSGNEIVVGEASSNNPADCAFVSFMRPSSNHGLLLLKNASKLSFDRNVMVVTAQVAGRLRALEFDSAAWSIVLDTASLFSVAANTLQLHFSGAFSFCTLNVSANSSVVIQHNNISSVATQHSTIEFGELRFQDASQLVFQYNTLNILAVEPTTHLVVFRDSLTVLSFSEVWFHSLDLQLAVPKYSIIRNRAASIFYSSTAISWTVLASSLVAFRNITFNITSENTPISVFSFTLHTRVIGVGSRLVFDDLNGIMNGNDPVFIRSEQLSLRIFDHSQQIMRRLRVIMTSNSQQAVFLDESIGFPSRIITAQSMISFEDIVVNFTSSTHAFIGFNIASVNMTIEHSSLVRFTNIHFFRDGSTQSDGGQALVWERNTLNVRNGSTLLLEGFVVHWSSTSAATRHWMQFDESSFLFEHQSTFASTNHTFWCHILENAGFSGGVINKGSTWGATNGSRIEWSNWNITFLTPRGNGNSMNQEFYFHVVSGLQLTSESVWRSRTITIHLGTIALQPVTVVRIAEAVLANRSLVEISDWQCEVGPSHTNSFILYSKMDMINASTVSVLRNRFSAGRVRQPTALLLVNSAWWTLTNSDNSFNVMENTMTAATEEMLLDRFGIVDSWIYSQLNASLTLSTMSIVNNTFVAPNANPNSVFVVNRKPSSVLALVLGMAHCNRVGPQVGNTSYVSEAQMLYRRYPSDSMTMADGSEFGFPITGVDAKNCSSPEALCAALRLPRGNPSKCSLQRCATPATGDCHTIRGENVPLASPVFNEISLQYAARRASMFDASPSPSHSEALHHGIMMPHLRTKTLEAPSIAPPSTAYSSSSDVRPTNRTPMPPLPTTLDSENISTVPASSTSQPLPTTRIGASSTLSPQHGTKTVTLGIRDVVINTTTNASIPTGNAAALPSALSGRPGAVQTADTVARSSILAASALDLVVVSATSDSGGVSGDAQSLGALGYMTCTKGGMPKSKGALIPFAFGATKGRFLFAQLFLVGVSAIAQAVLVAAVRFMFTKKSLFAVLSKARCPSLFFSCIVLLAQGIVLESLDLLVSSSSTTLDAYSFGSLVTLIAFCGVLAFVLWWQRVNQLGQDRKELPSASHEESVVTAEANFWTNFSSKYRVYKHATAELPAVLLAVAPRGYWTPSSPFSAFFSSFLPRWHMFVFVRPLRSVAVAVIATLPEAWISCSVRLILLSVLMFIVAALTVIAAPHRSRANLVVSAFLSILCGLVFLSASSTVPVLTVIYPELIMLASLATIPSAILVVLLTVWELKRLRPLEVTMDTPMLHQTEANQANDECGADQSNNRATALSVPMLETTTTTTGNERAKEADYPHVGEAAQQKNPLLMSQEGHV